MIYGIIYRATNLVNGKTYIGQTKRTLKERKYDHIRVANKNGDYNPLISKSIRKYGEDNFNWSIIDEADTLDELNEKEVYWIRYYNSFIGFENCNGYNMTLGGDGTLGRILTEEQKRAIGDKQFGELNHMYGKTGELNHMYGRVGELSPMFGMSGELSPTSIPVVRISLDGKLIDRFSNAIDGAKSMGNLNGSGITKACKGQSRHCKGYIWLYEEDCNEENVEKAVENAKTKRKGRKVVQLTMDGEFIAIYDSIKIAEIAIVGKSMGGYSKCL